MTDPQASPAAWRSPPAGLALGATDVHVWRLPLAQPREHLALLARTLNHDERERARRFYFDRDRNAFTAARGALRTLAGHYAAHPPADLGFGYQAKGKPYLTTPPVDLRFNLSHSGDFALLAFTRGRELGVDVERRRPMDDLLSVARTAFSPEEYATLCSLPVHEHTVAFFACWSRKEAFIKTTGEGVSQLADFDVNLRPGEPAQILRVAGVLPGQYPWSIHDLPAIPDHAASLVVESHDVRISCWDWSPNLAGTAGDRPATIR